MSGTMKIEFAEGVQLAAVEVLSPDLETVATLSMQGGAVEMVDVPSEASFLRVHLPSGRTVIIQHPGNLEYLIDQKALGAGAPVSKRREGVRSTKSFSPKLPMFRRPQLEEEDAADEIPDGSGGGTSLARPASVGWGLFSPEFKPNQPLLAANGIEVSCSREMTYRVSPNGRSLRLQPGDRHEPEVVNLRVRLKAGDLKVNLSGDMREARIVLRDSVVCVEMATHSPLTDTVGSYLLRGNYSAASSMARLVSDAWEMLREKRTDPLAAVAGGYLLLRLKRFDLLQDWPRNLADWFPRVPDGAVIWAAQCIAERKDYAEARKYLRIAIERGLPAYTEGLRLLLDGLVRVDGQSGVALQRLTESTGQVLWNSPFTAGYFPREEGEGSPPAFKIGYLGLK
jgi:hypothetical protein